MEDFDETLPSTGLPSKLPPLEAKTPKKGRKKKKKVLQKLAHEDYDGEVQNDNLIYLAHVDSDGEI